MESDGKIIFAAKSYMRSFLIFFLFGTIVLCACSSSKQQDDRTSDIPVFDQEIPPFDLIDQENQPFRKANMNGKVVVVDFFFKRCPTICPKMKANMHSLYTALDPEENWMFASFTIDPENDDVAVLKDLSTKLEVDSEKWKFITGSTHAEVQSIADSLAVYVDENNAAPGGFEHQGYFILFDQDGKVRGYYDGTDEAIMPDLQGDIETLLKE